MSTQRDLAVPTQLGFGEFVSELISETFDGLVRAEVQQERSRAEALRLASAPTDLVAAEAVTEEDVDDFFRRWFPHPRTDDLHGIFVGAPYRPPAKDGTPDLPPIHRVLDLTLEKEDLDKKGRLNARAVRRIRRATSLRLAEEQQALLQQLIQRGTPRVLVPQGRISARLAFHLEGEGGEPPEEKSPAEEAAPSTPSAADGAARKAIQPADPGGRWSPNPRITQRRILVQPPQEPSSQGGGADASVFGEVRLDFRVAR